MVKSTPLTCLAAVLVAVVVILQLQVSQAQADTFSCAGSTLCRGLAQSDCDAARRQIQPNNRYFTGGNKGATGARSGKHATSDDSHLGIVVVTSTLVISYQ
ncbi:hypothetical protein CTI12_AA491140 [Artemisia annua]|uniref:Uncharacterized protein n=1 Tax=Artemisia annua TaxID=35608 RepID=A0A2U1LHH0_ARTAN|nr:hypothetical protein CTI12_AA491140 [Artemisia annua]